MIFFNLKKIFKYTLYLIFFLIIDFSLSNLILKGKKIWEYEKLLDHYWRIKSDTYHHTLLENIDVIEPWGFSLKKRLITNSLGFRDFTNKKVKKIPQKKRLLLIGDSAIEGAGYDYEYTIGGLLQNHLSDDYEILNSAVSSYSPSVYYHKIKYFLEEGYRFDKSIIFLDPSDIIDELFINIDKENKIITSKKPIKRGFEDFLVNNFLTFRTFVRFTDAAESLKNYLKLRYKASIKYKKKFFKTTVEDTMYYRMTHVDRSAWTFDNRIFENYEDGLEKSRFFMNKLIKILESNNIETYFVLYQHPAQIAFKDLYHRPYWIKWAEEKDINYIDLYFDFDTNDSRKKVLETFIFGDLHWNKLGTKLVFNSLIKQIRF